MIKNTSHEEYTLSHNIITTLSEALTNDEYSKVADIAKSLNRKEIVDFLIVADNEQRIELISIIGKNLDPRIFVDLEIDLCKLVINVLGLKETAKLISKLDDSSIINLLQILDDGVAEQILNLFSPELRNSINEILTYPQESAGRLAHKQIIVIPRYWTVDKTINFLKYCNNLPDNFEHLVIIDANNRPVGTTNLSKIVSSHSKTIINDIMNSEFKVIRPHMDQEEVAYIFNKHDLLSAPVVDEQGKIIGIIYLNDITKIIKEEAEQEMFRLGGIAENDIYSGSFQTFTRRFPWIFLNILMATCTAFSINFFDATISKLVTLATLMPMIASTGGNVGIQSFTVVLRAIEDREINELNTKRILAKEILAALVSGFVIAIISFFALYLLIHNYQLSLIFSFSIIIIFTLSAMLGTIIPITLDSMGIDPFTSSSVLLTTCTDILSYSIFLGLATILLI